MARSSALVPFRSGAGNDTGGPSNALVRIKDQRQVPRPQWHAPWKLMRVISGHLGWVRAVAVDPSNEWFATGAGDRLIKVKPNWGSIVRAQMLKGGLSSFADLGPCVRDVETLVDGSHLHCSRNCHFVASPVPLFMRRR